MEGLWSPVMWGTPVGLGIFMFLMGSGTGILFWGMSTVLRKKWLARISPGLSCDEREDLAVTPIAIPAAIQHQCAQGGQRITGRQTPMHPGTLLALRHDQIVGLFDMRTPG